MPKERPRKKKKTEKAITASYGLGKKRESLELLNKLHLLMMETPRFRGQ